MSVNPIDFSRQRLSGVRMGRRDALKVGGITLSLGALLAACGDDRTGSEDPGRVGYAPPITDPPPYPLDDTVLLRTAASVEYTIIEAYGELDALGVLDGETTELLGQFAEHHRDIADTMNELAVAAGGEAWECTNEWMMDRLVGPVMATIADSDDQARDALTFAVSLENLAAETNQQFSTELSDADQRVAAIEAATLESRQSAVLVISIRGADGYISPAVRSEDEENDEQGLPQKYAVVNQFGSVGQFEMVIGPPDENGTRTTYVLQTPAGNSYVYNELEPTC